MSRATKRATVAKAASPPAPVKNVRRIVSIRLIISAVTTLLIAVSVIGFGNLAERNTRDTLNEEIENRLLLEARNLASLSVDALLSDFPELTLCPLVSEMQAGRQDLAFVAVLDHEDKVRGHIDLSLLDGELNLMNDMSSRPTTHQLDAGEKVLANADLVLAAVPARHANGRQVGTALVGLDQSYLDERVARPRRAFLMLTGGLLVVGVLVTLIIMSILLRPIDALRRGLERIGRGELDSPIRLKDKTELGLLAETVNGMASQLLVSQDQMLEKERLGAEMSLAHQMQHSLLPDGEVRSGDFVCKGTYLAAAEVGGDYYDIFELADGKLGLVIADVSGKGLAGCLVTSMLAVLIRSLRDRIGSPREMLINLEKGLKTSLAPGTFITVFYGILDPGTGKLTFASAGHSPLAVYRATQGQVEWFYTKGIPVGALRNGALAGTLKDKTIRLWPGDVALQFTDGLNEAWNPERQEQFDFERIGEFLEKTGARGGAAVQKELLPVIQEWTSPDPLGDDFTLLAVECAAAPSAAMLKDGQQLADQVGRLTNHQQLNEMLQGTQRLNIISRMEYLDQIGDWVETCLEGEQELSQQKNLIESSLFEVCANIIEHGYDNDPNRVINLWWVPLPGGTRPLSEFTRILAADANDGQEPRDGVGYFVICDHGESFDPTTYIPPNLHDPNVRRRGRGLGWQIIYSSMKKVVYAPDTPAGNLTLLRFDPAKHLVP
jgi:sigma-B regulation protein RsbU (phosphoserine phosphatase)